MSNKRQILFEISYQDSTDGYFNYAPGVYYKQISSRGDTRLFYDAFGNIGYYDYESQTLENVLTVQVDGYSYTPADSLNDCLALQSSTYWDGTEQLLYIHFENNERPLAKEILIDFIEGFANNFNDITDNVYGGVTYEPRLKKVGKLKNSVDPLNFGKLKFNTSNVTLENADGYFDNWRDRKIFNTPARIKYADNPTSYADFEIIFNGFISDDGTGWDEFSVSLDDPRKNLEQPVADRLINTTIFPAAPSGSVDKLRPVVYAKVFYIKCICIDDGGSPSKFLFVDTEFNQPSNLDGVYIDGVTQSPENTDLTAGTFELDTEDIDNVYASFTMGISNGVAEIKDLMLNYDELLYLDTFWDTDEVDYAETRCRNTSLYIDKDSPLNKAIEKICFDCDLRFFVKNNGKYTIRLYEEDRQPSATIKYDDWIGQPDKDNTGSNYLTSTTIEYQYRQDTDKYMLQYANTDYESTALTEYKKKRPKTYQTGLYEESAAIDKSETIMSLRSSVSDIVKRSVNWSFKDLEVTDFVCASPFSRVSNGLSEVLSIWEIVDIQKDVENAEIQLTLRYVKEAPATLEGIYFGDGSNQYTEQAFADGSEGETRAFSITEEG